MNATELRQWALDTQRANMRALFAGGSSAGQIPTGTLPLGDLQIAVNASRTHSSRFLGVSIPPEAVLVCAPNMHNGDLTEVAIITATGIEYVGGHTTVDLERALGAAARTDPGEQNYAS